jgi:hypothetical protein
VSEWQPIETAPKDGTLVVLVGKIVDGWAQPTRACVGSWSFEQRPPYFVAGWAFVAPGYIAEFNPTHWMPLPEPPRG